MTSMLLTDRYDFATSGAAVVAVSVAAVTALESWLRAGKPISSLSPRSGEGRVSSTRRSGFLAAVARSDVLFLRVRSRRLLDHRPHQLAIGLDPIGDHLPLLAVPLLELDRSAALVIRAGHLDCLHEPGRAEVFQARLADLQVLDAPAHLLAGQRLLAVFLLCLADRFDGDDTVHHAAVVIDAADARLIFHLPLALGVDILLDFLDHREVGARDVEAGRAVAFRRVSRG